MIITIDGTVGTGKSTLAKTLAKALGFIYLDTGAMYRAITYGIIKNKVDYSNNPQLLEFLHHFNFDMRIHNGEKHYFLNTENVTTAIRSAEVTALVSAISALAPVREKLTTMQRKIAVGVNAIFEGRDMGTVVFPDAEVKVFLTGRPEVRAKRRYEEICAKNPKEAAHLTLEKVLADLTERDTMDSTRSLSPLRQPENALIIDTSDLTIDDIVFKIIEYKDSLPAQP